MKIKLPGRRSAPPPEASVSGSAMSSASQTGAALQSDPGDGLLPAASRLGALWSWLRRYGLWGLAGFATFIVLLVMMLPTRAIAWRIGYEAKRAGYDIEVGDVSVSLLGGLTLEEVRWTFQPSRPGQVPSTLEIEEVGVDVAVLKLMFGVVDLDLEAQIDDGKITGNWYKGKDEIQVRLEVTDLPLYAVPKARQALNAPLQGTVALKVELTVPEKKFAQTQGVIEVACAACRVGDGETLLFVPGARGLLAKGVTVPEIDLGTLSGRIVFEDGKGATDGPIEAESDDVKVTIEGTVDLKDPFRKSRMSLVMKLDVAQEFQQREDSIRLLVQTAPKSQRLDAPESGLGFKLTGPVSHPRLRGIKSKSKEERLRERREKARKRAEKRAKRKRKKRKKKKPKKKADVEDKTAGDDGDGGSDGDGKLKIEPAERGDSAPRVGAPVATEPDSSGTVPGSGGDEPPAGDDSAAAAAASGGGSGGGEAGQASGGSREEPPPVQ